MHPALRRELPAIRTALRSPWPYLITLLALAWAVVHTNANLAATLALTLFAAQLALLAVVDLRTFTLPHLLTGLLALTGVVAAPLVLAPGLLSSLMGGALAFAGLFACMLVADKLSGRESLGGGDLWLTAAIGLWLGAGGLPMFVVAAALTGAVSVAANRLAGKRRQPFPFGPALAAAGWLAVLYHPVYWVFTRALAASL